MWRSNSCHGIHRSLLDSVDADSGDSRSGRLSCEREARKECAGATNGRFRLSVVAVPAFSWLVARLLSSLAGNLCNSFVTATSGKPGGYGELPCPAHAK